MACSIQDGIDHFLNELKRSENGFYFLEADQDRDLKYLRGFDYRNGTCKGLCLVLAAQFQDQVTYLQAKGRISRGSDEGTVFTLPMKMWKEE